MAKLAKFEPAEHLLLQSYETLRKSPGGGSLAGYIEETRGFLTDLYKIWGKPQQAAMYVAD